MGSKKSKPLDTGGIKSLTTLTGLDQFTVEGLSNQFQKNSKDGMMSKKQFRKMYADLTPGLDPESSFKLNRLADRVFKAFDKDHSGTMTFDEFAAAYVMLKNQGSARSKMEFLLKRVTGSEDGSVPANISSEDAKTVLRGLDAGFDTNNADKALNAMMQHSPDGGATIPTSAFVDTTTRSSVFGDYINRKSSSSVEF